MADVNDYLEEQIEKVVGELENEDDPKVKEQLRQDLKDFARLRNEGVKIDFECSDKVDRFLLDKKNSEETAELKKKQIKSDIITAVVSGAITLIGIATNVLMMGSIMNFEQTGTIRSKAFQFIGKPNLFKKV